MSNRIELSLEEIIDLAGMAGLCVSNVDEFDQDELATQVTILENQRVYDEDDQVAYEYDHIAYFSEYWEEGAQGLGGAINKITLDQLNKEKYESIDAKKCPLCLKPWSEHDFGVPKPECP